MVDSVKYWEGIGRRKTATVRVRIYEDSKIKNSINGKPVNAFFSELEIEYITKPFRVLDLKDKRFSFTVKANGGGKTGWKDAIRLGIARALIKYNPEFKPALRKAGFVTRDPRAVERKKVGLKKARKAPRFSKR